MNAKHIFRMKNITLQQSNVTLAAPYSTVSQAVAALTETQRNRLEAIARKRIFRLAQSAAVSRLLAMCEPLEFVDDTVMVILLGEFDPKAGRRTHIRHLASPVAFFNFVQSVMHSRISAHLKRECRAVEHQQGEIESAVSRTVVQDVVLAEIRAELLARLRAVAGNNPALHSALQWLELDSPDTGPKPTRKQIWKMRRAGRDVLREIAAGAQVQELFQS